MRSLVMKVMLLDNGDLAWSERLEPFLKGDGVDLLHAVIDHQDCDAVLVSPALQDQLSALRKGSPLAVLAVVAKAPSPEKALYWIRMGADEVVDEADLTGLYSKLRLALERRKQEWNRSLRDGHLYQLQKLEAVGRMSLGVAHDVRHLSQIILGNCSLALRLSNQGELQEMLCDIRGATQKSLTLTERLLRFVIDEPYRGQTHRLDQWLENQRPLLQATNQRRLPVIDCTDEARWLQVDPALLEQILLNLVINSLDALGRQGSLWIGVDGVEVGQPFLLQERCLEPGHYAVLTVADDGAGVPQKHLKSIFEPFFTTKRERGGTGLGLSTILALLHSQHGNLLIQSFEGAGTCTRVFLPASDPAPQREAFRPGSVLIIEADPGERLNHRQYLESLGRVVLEARDPGEALRLLKCERPAWIVAEAHQLAGYSEQLGKRAKEHLVSLEALGDDCGLLVTSLFPQSWLQRKGLLPQGWSYLAKPWDARRWRL